MLLHVFTYLLWFFRWLVKICISILYIDGRCNLRFNFECEMPIYKCIRFMVTFRCTKMCVRMWMCVKALIQHTFSFAKHCDCYENLKFGVEYNYLKNIILMWNPQLHKRDLASGHNTHPKQHSSSIANTQFWLHNTNSKFLVQYYQEVSHLRMNWNNNYKDNNY